LPVDRDQFGGIVIAYNYLNLQRAGPDMDLREAIYTRRAVRDFTAEPVEEKALRQLIDAAVQAPSAVNQQP
jgi:hypothetical protein